jgi:superfamily II DNA or RNA helicase
LDWGCDCGREICIHAAAVVIAAKQRASGAASPSTQSPRARLHYNLKAMGKNLRLDRELLRGDSHEPFVGNLRNLQGVHLTKADFVVEEVLQLGNTKIPNVGWRRILKAWEADNTAVSLNSRRMRISAKPMGDIARVVEHEDGFRVSLVRNNRIDEAFGGVVRAGNRLHPKGESPLNTSQRSALIRGVFFDKGEAGRLVADFLPGLRKKVYVQVLTDKLPVEIQDLKPHLVAQMEDKGSSLQVIVDVVYGDPPIGRLRRGKLELFSKTIPIRDEKEEARLLKQAEYSLKLPLGQTCSLPGAEAALWVQERLPKWRGSIVGNPGRFAFREKSLEMGIKQTGKDIYFESEAAPEAIISAWREGRSLVPLTDGGWAPLPKDFMEKYGELVSDLLSARNADGSLPKHATIAAAEIAQALDCPLPRAMKKLRPLLEDFESLPEKDIPADLQGTLRHYQEIGFRWMAFLAKADLGGILADDMGLGKTLQTLCLLRDQQGPHLVIAPTSVLHNWRSEAARFFPKMTVCLYHGPQRKLDTKADLILSSYALMRLDSQLQNRKWKTVILDESQAIKNAESQTAQAAYALQAKQRFALTGTPVENRLEELWSQFHFVMPGFLGGRKKFQETYARPMELGEMLAGETLRRRIKPFVLRRMKREVAPELPPLTELVLRCPMPEEQRDIYKAVHQAAKVAIEADSGIKTLQVLEHLLRLRQAACHPRLLPGDRPNVSGKMDLLIRKLKEVICEGHKALVFSQWTGFLDLIQTALDKENLKTVRLDGATRNRAAAVDTFQSDDGPPIFLISLKAGGTGLNLTAADYVFLVDPWWNPAVESQATDRAHRIGQDKPVIAVRLIAEDSVEERILALQSAKKELAEAAIGGAESFTGKLSRSDLLSVFD